MAFKESYYKGDAEGTLQPTSLTACKPVGMVQPENHITGMNLHSSVTIGTGTGTQVSLVSGLCPSSVSLMFLQ